jgi:hypothetical protein
VSLHIISNMKSKNESNGKILALKEEIRKVVSKYNYEALELRRAMEGLPRDDPTGTIAFVQRETMLRILADLEELLK